MDALVGYINKNMDYPIDASYLCKNYELIRIKEPVDLNGVEKKSDTKKLIRKTHIQMYVWRVDTKEHNCQSIFSIIWGQYRNSMTNKL